MADLRDVRAMKIARSEFSRHGIDVSRADIHMTHGVLHVGGFLTMPNVRDDKTVRHELEIVSRLLKSRPDFRDVIIEPFSTH